MISKSRDVLNRTILQGHGVKLIVTPVGITGKLLILHEKQTIIMHPTEDNSAPRFRVTDPLTLTQWSALFRILGQFQDHLLEIQHDLSNRADG